MLSSLSEHTPRLFCETTRFTTRAISMLIWFLLELTDLKFVSLSCLIHYISSQFAQLIKVSPLVLFFSRLGDFTSRVCTCFVTKRRATWVVGVHFGYRFELKYQYDRWLNSFANCQLEIIIDAVILIQFSSVECPDAISVCRLIYANVRWGKKHLYWIRVSSGVAWHLMYDDKGGLCE